MLPGSHRSAVGERQGGAISDPGNRGGWTTPLCNPEGSTENGC